MRMLSRQNFMKFSPGIFFAKGENEFLCDGFCIKGETIQDDSGTNIDFFYHNLVDIESDNSDEYADRVEEMLKNGTSYPINKSEQRDGCFDDDDVFLVFEASDLVCIAVLIHRHIHVSYGLRKL